MSFSNIKHSREAINQNLQDMFSSFRDDSHIPNGFRRVNHPLGSPLIDTRYLDAQKRQARHHRHSPLETRSQHSEDETEHHVNAANLFNKSGPSSPKDDPSHTDARLRAIERAKKAYKDEQAARKEKLRRLEEENALLELKKKALQEEEDRLYAQKLQS